jgi:hypothetical protein
VNIYSNLMPVEGRRTSGEKGIGINRASMPVLFTLLP